MTAKKPIGKSNASASCSTVASRGLTREPGFSNWLIAADVTSTRSSRARSDWLWRGCCWTLTTRRTTGGRFRICCRHLLADPTHQCGVTRRTVTDWESGHVAAPPIETLARLFDVDVGFLAREDAPDLDPDNVSFRALSSVGARKAKRVVAAARISLELSKWFDDQYQTPGVDLPSLDDLLSPLNADDYSPERASKMLRQIWSLSDRPVKNMLWLLERQGVRIFSLPGEDRDVDAFSFWHGGRPYIFINPDKSAERLRFDLAHELGHLILHKGVSTARERH